MGLKTEGANVSKSLPCISAMPGLGLRQSPICPPFLPSYEKGAGP